MMFLFILHKYRNFLHFVRGLCVVLLHFVGGLKAILLFTPIKKNRKMADYSRWRTDVPIAALF